MIRQITNETEKTEIARSVLEALPAWFGLLESREAYIDESKSQLFFAAFSDKKPIGFLCLKETGKATVELAVMGVLKEFHHQGIGRELFFQAREIAIFHGYSFLQVKTVQMGKYLEYDSTNLFYKAMGFQEFEIFPALWDENNPCQIYIMSLK